MRLTVSALLHRFVLFLLILLPFNSIPWFENIFGELSGEGAFYAALIIVGLGLISLISSLGLPRGFVNTVSVRLLVFFIGTVLISFFSITVIIDSQYKGRSGLDKLLLQSAVILFCLIFTIISALSVRTSHQKKTFLNWVVISTVIPVLVGLIQLVGVVANQEYFQNLSITIANIFSLPSEDFYYRVRGVSGEASWFGLWISFILPWIFVKLQTARRSQSAYYKFLVLLLLFLIFYSYSRTAAIIAMAVTLVYVVVERRGIQSFNFEKTFFISDLFRLSVKNILAVSVVLLVYLYYQASDVFSLEVETAYGLSNIARFGSQYAAVSIGIDNIISGVGLGQFGFYAPAYYPGFSIISDEINIWSDPTVGTAWPPVHSLYVRIFAELGLVGLFLWFVFLLSIFATSARAIRKARNVFEIRFWAAHFSSTLGVVLGGMSSDSFRFFGFWLLVAMAIAYRADHSVTRRLFINNG